jgi:hypothetical protein
VRDPVLPWKARVGALRSAVVLYQPLGWALTLSFLDQAVGGYASGEQALLLALDLRQPPMLAGRGVRVCAGPAGGQGPRPAQPATL